jgi:hypothetical protein
MRNWIDRKIRAMMWRRLVGAWLGALVWGWIVLGNGAGIRASFVETAERYTGGIFFLIGVAALISLLAIIGLLATVLAVWNVPEEDAQRRVAAWGDPDAIAESIRTDIADGDFIQVGRHKLTNRHVVCDGLFFFDVYQLRDLLWVYLKTTTSKTSGMPSFRQHDVCLLLSEQAGVSPEKTGPAFVSVEISGRNRSCERGLLWLTKMAPWAMSGYSEDVERGWATRAREMQAEVQSRRAEVEREWETRSGAVQAEAQRPGASIRSDASNQPAAS